jgi:site-specific recombinase XerD
VIALAGAGAVATALASCDLDGPGPPRGGGPRHLIAFRELAGRFSLARLAAQYLSEEVFGIQSPNTLDAKSRDLTAFVTWFVQFNGHGDIQGWLPRDTQAYLNNLEQGGRAPTTVNRVFATLRRFAKWAHEQPGHVFERGGLPTRGIKTLAVDEPDCKKLPRQDIHQLFKAADALERSEVRKNARPRRNRAILAVLYYTGLRVSELVALKRDQYQESYLVNVARKGKSRSKGLYLVAECRKHLDVYLAAERPLDDVDGDAVPLFLPARRAGARQFMTRQLVAHLLTHIAQEANKHAKQNIRVHPHQLRHTFGAEYRHKSGSDTETAAALGHTGLQYVGRYVRRSQDERESVLEEMFDEAAARGAARGF